MDGTDAGHTDHSGLEQRLRNMLGIAQHGRVSAARLLIVVAIMLAAGAGCCASFGGDAVRIVLKASPYTSPQSVTLTCTSDYVVTDLSTNELIAQREAGAVWIATTRPVAGTPGLQKFRIRIRPLDPDGLVRIMAPVAKRDRYRGALEIATTSSGTLRLLNELPLEDYLRGVVPAEMHSSFELEALKAQAVAARTYVIRESRKHASDNANLCNTVCCQVYGGAAVETAKADRAVAETCGKILCYNGKPIVAMYHSDCGGTTESAANTGFAEGAPYLRSTSDIPDDGGRAFCVNGHAHRWSAELTGEAVAGALQEMGHSVGSVTDAEITSRDDTGRVKELTFRGTYGRTSVPASGFRMACGSTRIKSTNFTIARSGGSFSFEGSGSGHGLGLCQYGANGRASAPYNQTYDEILSCYYSGAVLTSLSDGSASLSGIVRQTGNGEPIASARVILLGSTRETQTDEQGCFRFDALSAGTYDVRIDRDGYRLMYRCNVRVPSGGAISVSATLEPIS